MVLYYPSHGLPYGSTVIICHLSNDIVDTFGLKFAITITLGQSANILVLDSYFPENTTPSFSDSIAW